MDLGNILGKGVLSLLRPSCRGIHFSRKKHILSPLPKLYFLPQVSFHYIFPPRRGGGGENGKYISFPPCPYFLKKNYSFPPSKIFFFTQGNFFFIFSPPAGGGGGKMENIYPCLHVHMLYNEINWRLMLIIVLQLYIF